MNHKELKAEIREYLSSALKPKRKKRYSLEQEKAQILEMVKSTVQKTLKERSPEIERIMLAKIKQIDWEEKIRETAELAIKRARGVVE